MSEHILKSCKDHGFKGTRFGYHQVRKKINGNYKTIQLHRLVYCEHNAVSLESIEGKLVRHYCDNPRCINPEHLLIGTHQDNVNDMMQRNRCRKAKLYSRTDLLTTYQYQYIQRNYVAHSRTYNAAFCAKALGLDIKVVLWAIMTMKHPKKQLFRVDFKINENNC